MRRALELAATSAERDEVPVGAVVVSAENIEIGSGSNLPISTCDPTAHAEMIALRAAGRTLSNYRLPGATLYVTIEPCTMCLGAMVHARIDTIVFAAREPKSGALVSHPIESLQRDSQNTDGLKGGGSDSRFNHRFAVIEGVLQQECRALMQSFFAQRRQS